MLKLMILARPFAEDETRGFRVDVPVGEEGLDERRVPGEVGQDAELDLGIIGGEEDVAFVGHEGPAESCSPSPARGDVLEVGFARGQPAGRSHGLIVGRVDAARRRIDKLRQGIGVGGFELGHLPVVEDVARQGMDGG